MRPMTWLAESLNSCLRERPELRSALCIAAVVVSFGLCHTATAACAAECVRPYPQSKTVSFGAKHQRWVATTRGLAYGTLFVVDCHGQTLAKFEDIGDVKRLGVGPTLVGEPTLKVWAVQGFGTNIATLSTVLLWFDGHSIATLWRHSAFDGSYPPPNLGPQVGDTYKWRFSRHNTRIDVRGVEVVGYRHMRTLALPSEHFCFRRNAKKFVPCK